VKMALDEKALAPSSLLTILLVPSIKIPVSSALSSDGAVVKYWSPFTSMEVVPSFRAESLPRPSSIVCRVDDRVDVSVFSSCEYPSLTFTEVKLAIMSYFCTNIAIKYMKKKTKRQHPSRKYREFSKHKEEEVGDNYAKNIRNVLLDFRDDRNMSPELTMFLLWAYEYEFFTMDYLDKRCGISQDTAGQPRCGLLLYQYGLLMTMYSKQSEGVSMEKMMMRNEERPILPE
jgi:hypothetical protein